MEDSSKNDTSNIRRALGSFTTGVTVVTASGREAGDVGLTANSFNSVSLDPPMVLWSLAKSAGSLPVFTSAEYFAVHILSEDQQELSNRFAKRGIDKFSGVEVERGPDDIPLITDCTARFVCRTTYQYEGGDHIIFVGEVIEFCHWQRPPLLFHGGQYGQLRNVREEGSEALEGEVPDGSLGALLRVSYQRLIEPLAKEVTRRGLSITQHYLLADIAISGRKLLNESLSALSVSGAAPSDEEVSELFEKGYLEEIEGKTQLTDPGFKLRIELASIYKAVESEALKSLEFEKAQSLKLLLERLINSLDTVA